MTVMCDMARWENTGDIFGQKLDTHVSIPVLVELIIHLIRVFLP